MLPAGKKKLRVSPGLLKLAPKRFQRPRDLLATFEPDGSVLVRAAARGVGAELDVFALGILTLCSKPTSREEVVAQLGEQGTQAGAIFDLLVELSLLVPAAEAVATPVMFGNFAGVNIHRAMLADSVRLKGYEAAIRAVVRPGDVVIDAGSGTGVLAVLAALAGARKVYAIEASEYARVARQVAADSGVADRVEVVQANFGDIELPEKARVLVTETFGAWVLAEGALPELRTCAQRNLLPDGVTIPQGFSLFLTPLERAPAGLLEPFVRHPSGLDLSSLRAEALGRAMQLPLQRPSSAPVIPVGSWPLLSQTDDLEAQVEVEGPCEALCAWFTLELAPGVGISTAPDLPQTSWQQTVLPVALGPGRHRLELTLSYAPDDGRTLLIQVEGAWTGEVRAR